jgi:hypothetical protein
VKRLLRGLLIPRPLPTATRARSGQGIKIGWDLDDERAEDLPASLTVTEAGLVYRYNLRRRLIGWPEIRSSGVEPSRRSRMRWPCLVIYLGNGSVTLNGLSSFTATYPARVASELSAMRRGLAPSLALGRGPPEGERP